MIMYQKILSKSFKELMKKNLDFICGNIVEIDNTGKNLKLLIRILKISSNNLNIQLEVERFLIKNSGVLWEVLMKH